MDLSFGLVALTAAYSLIVGSVSALMGIGGGILIVPFLVLALGESQHLAEGTSLLVIVPTALMGVWAHHRKGYVRFGAALRLGLGGVLGSVAGASLALAFSAELLTRSFGAFTVVMGIRFIRSGLRAVRAAR
jgi:uncharacterized membrane protein YfcA